MTPYLSTEWFRLWKVALDEAERLGMNVWIYDENSYPSGFAGGWVPELMPASRGRGLGLRESTAPPPWNDQLLGVYRLTDDRAEQITSQVKQGAALPEGRYVAASLLRAGDSPWHGNRSYVDLLYPGVTAKFLEVTLEAYRREIGSHFGRGVPGVFTDEPQIAPAGGLPWTDDLPARFEQRWGYRLLEHLPSLSHEVGDWRKVRHNYYQVLLDLFVERWAKPYYDYCAQHQLEFTGHYWEHEWPVCRLVPDNMAMAAWQQRPGIDTLMNHYEENTHAQFGNVRAVREITSLANQLGRGRTLCELYGAGGWDLRFEDMKRIGDWLAVLGVNTFDEHLSYITLRGARKRDHPQSFSYHEPWWEAYHVNASYLSRLSVALTHGQQVHHILILEPTTTAWLYNSAGKPSPRLAELGNQFFDLLMALERHQIEYDLGCEDVLAHHGSVQGPLLRVGQREYRAIVLPPFTENLNARTLTLLQEYLRAGGTVFACGDAPTRIDGALADQPRTLSRSATWRVATPDQLPRELKPVSDAGGIILTRSPDDRGVLFHHRRELADGQLLFLVNSSLTVPTKGSLEASAGGVERWDPFTGQVQPYPFAPAAGRVRAEFHLPPSGSLLLFLPRAPMRPPAERASVVTDVAAVSPVTVQRLAPNVLTLDYVDITAGDETRSNVYFYAANQFAYRQNGLERNPWDSAVQFKDELVTRTFPAGSGFVATYHFRVADAVPPDLTLVVECPELYTVACNGQTVTAAKDQWWLDRAFGRIALGSIARVGDNTVTLRAGPFRIDHELEPAYLLGDFRLEAVERGFAIHAAQPPLRLGQIAVGGSAVGRPTGAWNEQGLPFYGDGVGYRQTFNVSRKRGHYRVALGRWLGSVAKVLVNGKPAGYIAAPPWECDVTSLIRRGDNTIEVVVIGTLKNTLGPHHGNPGLGSAWPGMFQRGPEPGPPAGKAYHTVGYGLFAPFGLRQYVPAR
jgi:hypothetical protein